MHWFARPRHRTSATHHPDASRGPRRFEDFTDDLRFGLRALRKRAGSTAMVIITLAVGIGATTAMFSIVDGVLLRPLPVLEESRVLLIHKIHPKDGSLIAFPYADLVALRQQSRAFQDIAGVQYDGARPYPILDGDRALITTGASVTGEFFRVLGMRPALGRLLDARDVVPGAEPVIVISYGLWQRQFGGETSVLGRPLRIGARTFTQRIVGVAAAGFEYPQGTEVWVPVPASPQIMQDRRFALFNLMGRLRPGATLAQAKAEAGAFLRQREAVYLPGEPKGHRADVATLRDRIVGDVRPVILLLFGAVVLLLGIASANVASLLLVRAMSRGGEVALRAVLGASRGRIVRQLLTEGGLLAVAGGALGTLLAFGIVKAFGLLAAAQIPRADEIGMSARTLAFAIAVSLAATMLAALAPALWSARPDLGAPLRAGRHVAGESGGMRLGQSGLVVVQVALALVVLVGAGLLLESLYRLQHLDLGFKGEHLTVAQVPLLSAARQTPRAARLALFDQITRRLEAVPGIAGATPVAMSPFSGAGGWDAFYATDRQSSAEAAEHPGINLEAIAPNYFRTLGIPLRRGRPFTAEDRAGSMAVAIVSEAMARSAWPGEDPIGKHLELSSPTGLGSDTSVIIVGVAGETRYRELVSAPPTVYLPMYQGGPPAGYLVVRATGAPGAVTEAIRRTVRELDPGEHVFRVAGVEQSRAEQLARPRLGAFVLGAFALVAVVLAAVGLFGLMASLVAQRTHEIGIRCALGAQPADVRRLILGRGLALAAIGVVVGLVAALAGTRVLTSILYGVSPTDPLTLVGAAAALLVTAALACTIPVRRATRVDPAVALRSE